MCNDETLEPNNSKFFNILIIMFLIKGLLILIVENFLNSYKIKSVFFGRIVKLRESILRL